MKILFTRIKLNLYKDQIYDSTINLICNGITFNPITDGGSDQR